jgi:hypothetical protein
MSQAIASQDNAATADPIFYVQELNRVYGFDPDYSDNHVYLDDEHNIVTDFSSFQCPECSKSLDVRDMDDEACTACFADLDLGDWPLTRTVYRDFWVNVQPFFTRQGAEEYLRVNGHNLCDPRIYVDSAFRNAEWQAVRDMLTKMHAEQESEMAMGEKMQESLKGTVLHGGDDACEHYIEHAVGGGVKCRKCGGWFCY